MFEDAEDHIATGSESLAEFAHNAGMDNPDRCWLLDSRDVWVRNPFYTGPEEPHPEDDRDDIPTLSDSHVERKAQVEECESVNEDYEKYYENLYDQDYRE